MPTPSLLQRLKERKLVQWAIAYLAGAWVIYEATATVGSSWGLTDTFLQGLFVVLAIGFFITLVLAWYHGEKGRQRVSGPELLMVAALLVVAGGVLSLLGGPSPLSNMADTEAIRGDDPALIVLTCDNISPRPEDAYLADGLHEAILHRLAGVAGLFLLGRETAKWYRENPAPPREIAVERGLDYVGECSVRKDPNAERFLVTFQLLNARGVHEWSKEYEGDYATDDLFDVQSDIAQRVVDAIGSALTQEEVARIEAVPTENLEAYDLLIRGDSYVRGGRAERNYRLAAEMYREAVSLDPDFAVGYARLANVEAQTWVLGFDRTEERLEAARRAAQTALALDPDLPEARLAMGQVFYASLDYDRALSEYSIARRHQPNNPDLYSNIAYVQRRRGEIDEAIGNLLRASELDPGNPMVLEDLAETHLLAGQVNQSERYYRQAISLVPDNLDNYVDMAHWLHLNLNGDIRKARALVEEAEALELGGGSDLEFVKVLLDVLDHDYQGALHRLESARGEVVYQDQFLFIPAGQLRGQVLRALGEDGLADEEYESTRRFLESKIEDEPTDERFRSALGIVYAGGNWDREAVREGRIAVDLMPPTKDLWRGLYRVKDLARIYTMVGDLEAAIETLDVMLSYPGVFGSAFLGIDPIWDPLRDHPRFQALLEEYRDDGGH